MDYAQISVDPRDIAATLNRLSRLREFKLIQVLSFGQNCIIVYRFNPQLENDDD